MNDNQINAAIAQACGWMDIEECTCGFKPRGNPPWYSADKKHIPDYCNDINAMHEAENVLLVISLEYWALFSNNLVEKMGCEAIFRATARQRAEAFLRVMGKWEEEQP